MPTIKITTPRRVWVDGAPRDLGDEVDVSADEAAALVALGFAEIKAAARAAAVAPVADDEPAPTRRRRVIEGDVL
jgi:hypothetical protein